MGFFHHHMLRIKTTFGAHETNAIDAVPFFEMAYFFTDGLDGSRAIGTENNWEFGGHVKLLSKTAFPLERIPDAGTGSSRIFISFKPPNRSIATVFIVLFMV